MIEKIRVADTVGLFTSDKCPPAAVAKRCWTNGSIIFGPTCAKTSARPMNGSRRVR